MKFACNKHMIAVHTFVWIKQLERKIKILELQLEEANGRKIYPNPRFLKKNFTDKIGHAKTDEHMKH